MSQTWVVSSDAHAYSEASKFISTIGMDGEEVMCVLGAPDRVLAPTADEVWYYSHSPSGASYMLRAVLFDTNGKVSAKWATLYID